MLEFHKSGCIFSMLVSLYLLIDTWSFLIYNISATLFDNQHPFISAHAEISLIGQSNLKCFITSLKISTNSVLCQDGTFL